MRRFLVDFPLGMIRPNVTVIACLGPACLFQAELVPQMAFLALSYRAIDSGLTNVMATLAGKAGHSRALEGENCIARLDGVKIPLWHGLELDHQIRRKVFTAKDSYIGW
jgi:hypothetical protein